MSVSHIRLVSLDFWALHIFKKHVHVFSQRNVPSSFTVSRCCVSCRLTVRLFDAFHVACRTRNKKNKMCWNRLLPLIPFLIGEVNVTNFNNNQAQKTVILKKEMSAQCKSTEVVIFLKMQSSFSVTLLFLPGSYDAVTFWGNADGLLRQIWGETSELTPERSRLSSRDYKNTASMENLLLLCNS